MSLLTNPTGGRIRVDTGGDGHYGASREQKGYHYEHKGVDFSGIPGQPVRAPISGAIIRESKPYPNEPYSGVFMVGKKGKIKMFYLQPDLTLIGSYISEGQEIGIMQDISQKYKDVTPHVHLQIEEFDPELLL